MLFLCICQSLFGMGSEEVMGEGWREGRKEGGREGGKEGEEGRREATAPGKMCRLKISGDTIQLAAP